jgi:hypothetical protein
MADLDDVPDGVALEDPAAHWDAWRPEAAATRLRGVRRGQDQADFEALSRLQPGHEWIGAL